MKEEKKNFYPEAVVFDMDGVMFDSERIVQYSFNKAGEEMGTAFWEMKIYVLLLV